MQRGKAQQLVGGMGRTDQLEITVVTCIAVWMVVDNVLERVLVENGLPVEKRVTDLDVL
jgi:hypothetical protein